MPSAEHQDVLSSKLRKDGVLERISICELCLFRDGIQRYVHVAGLYTDELSTFGGNL